MGNQINLFNEGLEKYPVQAVITENLSIAIWLTLGTFIISQISFILSLIFLTAALIMIIIIMRKLICTGCYYYGKRCHVAWGNISALLYKQGKIEEFSGCTGQKIAPVLFGLMALIPAVSGIISMILNFSVYKLMLFILLLAVILYSSVISRKMSCAKCKMKIICPGSAA
ncbi:MAG: hypothetical protein JW864_03450 [Spirochaetes bacterium]|nr:hypothetical protein [Spirochaetota bacterium]